MKRYCLPFIIIIMFVFFAGCDSKPIQNNNLDALFQTINKVASENSLVNKNPSELYGLLSLNKDQFEIHTFPGAKQFANLQISLVDQKVSAYDFAIKLSISKPVAYEVNAEHSIWVIGNDNTAFRSYNGLDIQTHITNPDQNSVKGHAYSGNIGSLNDTYVEYVYITIPE